MKRFALCIAVLMVLFPVFAFADSSRMAENKNGPVSELPLNVPIKNGFTAKVAIIADAISLNGTGAYLTIEKKNLEPKVAASRTGANIHCMANESSNQSFTVVLHSNDGLLDNVQIMAIIQYR